MKLEEIQGNLRQILIEIPLLATVTDWIAVDDGTQNQLMEELLQREGVGFFIMIIAPQGFDLPMAVSKRDTGFGAVLVNYVTTIWVRTNPKIQINGAPVWNPLQVETEILDAVMKWSRGRSDLGFHLVPTLEPETDFADHGNFSRLIRVATRVVFK
jgi:hypothetical protein